MANVWAIKSGNWSDPTMWNTGALPTSADTVFANNFTVTIDQDINVTKITLEGITGVSQGGSFTVASVAAGVTRKLVIATAVQRLGADAITLTIPATNGTVDASGVNVIGAYNINNGPSVLISATGGTVLIGKVTGGSASGWSRALTVAAGTVTVTGDVVGGPGGNGWGIQTTGGDTTVTGDVIGSAQAVGVQVEGGILRCKNVKNGTGAEGININAANSTVYCTSAISSGNRAAIAIGNYGGIVVDVDGPVTASGNANAIFCRDAIPVIRAKGPFKHGPNNFAPIFAMAWMVRKNTATSWTVKDDSATPNTGADVVLSNLNSSPAPTQSDVRDGVTYGGGLTGTLKVPPAASVVAGVPVDNTVGTASLDINKLVAVIGDQIAAASTAG